MIPKQKFDNQSIDIQRRKVNKKRVTPVRDHSYGQRPKPKLGKEPAAPQPKRR